MLCVKSAAGGDQSLQPTGAEREGEERKVFSLAASHVWGEASNICAYTKGAGGALSI